MKFLLLKSINVMRFLGDFFSNISLSKRGFGEMALGGCYGAPVFNLLMGLGLSFVYINSRRYPQPYVLQLDTASFISLGFIYVSLFSAIIVVPLSNFRFEKALGMYLISLYALYIVVQASLLLSGVH